MKAGWGQTNGSRWRRKRRRYPSRCTRCPQPARVRTCIRIDEGDDFDFGRQVGRASQKVVNFLAGFARLTRDKELDRHANAGRDEAADVSHRPDRQPLSTMNATS